MLSKKRFYKKSTKKADTAVKTSVKKVIRKMVKQAVEPAQEMQYLQLRGSQASIGRPYYALNLMDFTSMRQVFGTNGQDYSICNKIQHKSIDFDFLFSCANEYANVTMRAFIVSLKKDQNVYNKTTGALNATTSGLEYADNDSVPNAGQSFLNPKMFHIHKSKKWESGNNNLSTLVASGAGGDADLKTVYRWIGSIRTDQRIQNPVGDFAALTCSQSPSAQYYLILFNDNITADGESPNLNFNILHTFVVPN